MNKVNIVQIEPLLVMGMRKEGFYKEIGNMIKELCEHAGQNQIEIVGPPIFICHENAEEAETAAQEGNAKLEVAIPITEKVRTKYKVYELPGGRFAEIMQKGPYDQCHETYNTLFKWIHDNNFQVKSLFFLSLKNQ